MPSQAQLVIVVTLSFLCACDSAGMEADGSGGTTTGFEDPCDDDVRGDDYAVGLSRTGMVWTVEYVDASPAPPAKGDNAWVIRATDTNGDPVADLDWEVLPFMPDHGHGSPVPVVVTALGSPIGDYRFEDVTLFMAGLWEVTFNMSRADGATDQVVFKFCVDP